MAKEHTNNDQIENTESSGFKIGCTLLLFFAMFIGPGLVFLIWWIDFIPVSGWWNVSFPSGRRLFMSLAFILGPEIFVWLGFVWSIGPKRAFHAAFMLCFMNSIFIAIGIFANNSPFVDQINACYFTSRYDEAVVIDHSDVCTRHSGSALPSCNLAIGIKFTGELGTLDASFITEEQKFYPEIAHLTGRTVPIEYRKSAFGISIFKVANIGSIPKCILPKILKPYLAE